MGKDYLARCVEREPMPRMHWRWIRRHRDLAAILGERYGGHLPDDDAGRADLQQLLNHLIRLIPHGHAVARANAMLLAPWITPTEIDAMMESALEALKHKPIPASKLGNALRLTEEEHKRLGITTITPFDRGADAKRRRQREWAAQKRRKAGAKSKRGRPSLNLSPEEKKARTNAQAAERMRGMRAQAVTQKASTSGRYIRETCVDEFSVTEPVPLGIASDIVIEAEPSPMPEAFKLASIMEIEKRADGLGPPR